MSKILALLARGGRFKLLYAAIPYHSTTAARLAVNRQDYDLRADAASDCFSFRGDCLAAFSQSCRCRRQPLHKSTGSKDGHVLAADPVDSQYSRS